MSSLALLFVGAVLLVNGLVLLGRIGARAAVPINLITGAGLVTASLVTAIPADADARLALFGAVGFSLFGVTYLTVAGGTHLGADGRALGWYCAWACAVAVVLAAINFAAGDAHIAWLWSGWAVLFFAFFLSGCISDPRFDVAAGVLAIAQSVTTATVPALLMIDGTWSELSIGWVAAAQGVGVVIAVASAARPRSAQSTAPAV
ncbi:putative amidase substrates transport protein [Gordonia hirsuta DSM 44140 = NBRC 16056]|uniref:Putative amidase substrates transport protein n=1 Tax=Gordonia hirsuta DSM 44140 = NBRC 16056 TaxID=1121927 RepID=L7LAZ7_9ACTN|nr:AmiS/UreI family transporter [Gordonia hirsuta]GAC57208.1 putative amidase substrates transport protein [Gordonia hirsuta DSM 44140 = NBRC 16056]